MRGEAKNAQKFFGKLRPSLPLYNISILKEKIVLTLSPDERMRPKPNLTGVGATHTGGHARRGRLINTNKKLFSLQYYLGFASGFLGGSERTMKV